MQVQNNSINFKGGFLFRNMPTAAKEELPNLINKGKQIHYGFEKPKNIFYIVKDSYDTTVKNFIKLHNLKFEYYPLINTANAAQEGHPEIVTNLIKDKKMKPIKTFNEMEKLLIKERENRGWKNNNNDIPYIFDKLRIDINDFEVNYSKGARIITPKDKSCRITISPTSELGMTYVIIEPKSLEQKVCRYILSPEYEILEEYNTPEGIILFQKMFKKTLKQ